MIKAFNRVLDNEYNEDDRKFLYPLMIWFSGNYKNIQLCNTINKNFYFCKNKHLFDVLFLGIDKSFRFIKYPKKRVEESEKDKILIKYLKLDEREFNKQKKIIDLLYQSKESLEELNKKVGFDKSECKILDVEFKTFKIDKKSHKKEEITLFSAW